MSQFGAKRNWLVIFLLSSLVSGSNVISGRKQLDIERKHVERIIEESRILYTPAQHLIKRLDMNQLSRQPESELTGSGQNQSAAQRFLVSFDKNISFLLPTGKSIQDYIGFAYKNNSHYSIPNISFLFDNTIEFCYSTIKHKEKASTLNLIELELLLRKTIYLCSSNNLSPSKDLHVESLAPNGLLFDAELILNNASSIYVYLPMEQSIDEFVSERAELTSVTGGIADSFLKSLAAGFQLKNSSGVRKYKLQQIIDEAERFVCFKNGSLKKEISKVKAKRRICFITDISSTFVFDELDILYISIDLPTEDGRTSDKDRIGLYLNEIFPFVSIENELGMCLKLLFELMLREESLLFYKCNFIIATKLDLKMVSVGEEEFKSLLIKEMKLPLQIVTESDLIEPKSDEIAFEIYDQTFVCKRFPYSVGKRLGNYELFKDYVAFVKEKIDERLNETEVRKFFFHQLWSEETLNEYERKLRNDELLERMHEDSSQVNNEAAISSHLYQERNEIITWLNTNQENNEIATRANERNLFEGNETTTEVFITRLVIIEEYSTEDTRSYSDSDSTRLRERIELQSEEMDLMLCTEPFGHNVYCNLIDENEYLHMQSLYESERQQTIRSQRALTLSELIFSIILPFIAIFSTAFMIYIA